MKRKTNILILILVVLTSCMVEKTDDYSLLQEVKWENSDLDFVEFDSTLVHISMKDFSTTCTFRYSVKTDTITILNKTINAYNLIEFTDSISILKIDFLTKDSIKFSPLNNGARELLKGFRNLKFYNPESVDRFSYYIEKDSTYLAQINQAKQEIKNNKLVLCLYWRFKFRNKKEFIKILETHNVLYKQLPPRSDVEPIARNCYKETMDYYIKKKFGKDFLAKINAQADTLMLKENPNKIYDFYQCDIEPQLVYKKTNEPNYEIPVTLNIKYDSSEYGGWPFIDLSFIVHKDSTISDLHVVEFTSQIKTNKKYVKELTKLAFEEMKIRYSIWTPGKILGKEVAANSNIRLHFVKKVTQTKKETKSNMIMRQKNEKTPHNTRLCVLAG